MTTDRPQQLSGLQRLWFVLTMIWIVLAAAVKVPELPVGAEAWQWARGEIEQQLRMFDQQASGTANAAATGVDENAHQPDEQYVAAVLADKGAGIAARICAAHPACPAADKWLTPALTGIDAELQRRLSVIQREQQALLVQIVALCLLPPLSLYLLGWIVWRLLARKARASDQGSPP